MGWGLLGLLEECGGRVTAVAWDTAPSERLQSDRNHRPAPHPASRQISGSLARAAIKQLLADGAIRVVSKSAGQEIYTRATNQ